MYKTKKKQNARKQGVRNVKLWLASFALLALAAILAVICFLSNILWLYFVCGAVLFAFVIWYSMANKAITHKDGYTLVQAIWFYRTCKKERIDDYKVASQKMEKIMKLAAEKDFTKGLSTMQVMRMFEVGRDLTVHIFGREEKG